MRRIPFARALALAFAGVALFAPQEHAIAQDDAARFPQPKLPVIRIQAGIHVIRAELADTGRTREIGLMGRESLGPNEGMLFVFERPAVHCFWMRNTPLPLSVAFIDDDGHVVDLAKMPPRSDDSHCPSRAVRFALEMEQGWFARHGIAVGARLLQPSVFPGQR
ncbi:MAG TPA: DUF192 domain-containing protein [Zeimonas sp.]